jgi:putative membrane protein
MQLSQEDHARIAQAVAEAESRVNGEIVCVLARRASEYRETPLAWACAAALVLPLILIPLGFGPSWLPNFAGGWVAAQSSAVEASAAAVLSAYAVVQAVVFLAALVVVSSPAVRRALTPASLRRERAREAALEQFVARGLHLGGGRVGVLIYVALAERQVQVLADQAIDAKVDQSVWNEAAAALAKGLKDKRPADGFVAAVEICGRVMAEHFPSTGENPNELPNDLVEI